MIALPSNSLILYIMIFCFHDLHLWAFFPFLLHYFVESGYIPPGHMLNEYFAACYRTGFKNNMVLSGLK